MDLSRYLSYLRQLYLSRPASPARSEHNQHCKLQPSFLCTFTSSRHASSSFSWAVQRIPVTQILQHSTFKRFMKCLMIAQKQGMPSTMHSMEGVTMDKIQLKA